MVINGASKSQGFLDDCKSIKVLREIPDKELDKESNFRVILCTERQISEIRLFSTRSIYADNLVKYDFSE